MLFKTLNTYSESMERMCATACRETAVPGPFCTAQTQRWCRKYRDSDATVEDAVRLAAMLRGVPMLHGWANGSMFKMKGVRKSEGSFSYLRQVIRGQIKMLYF